jgi:4-hydroxy-2-oxoglutarate aldolase
MKLFVLVVFAFYFRGKQEREMRQFKGIFPPIVTPFEKQQVSFTHLAENIKKWNNYDLSGYVILGSNGENVMLTTSECLEVVETAVKYVPEEKSIIVGAGSESTFKTVNFIKQVHQTGGDAVLVVTPHYYKAQLTPPALERYYLEIADNSPLPVIIYHVPKFTGIDMPADLVARLSEHPQILGMKDSSGNLTYFQSLISLGLKEFQLLTGNANTLMTSLVMGAAGGVLALANIAPQICIDIFRFIDVGNLKAARELQLKVLRLNQLTTAVHGIGGLKFALDQLGYFGGEPRHPLSIPEKSGQAEIKNELDGLSLL